MTTIRFRIAVIQVSHQPLKSSFKTGVEGVIRYCPNTEGLFRSPTVIRESYDNNSTSSASNTDENGHYAVMGFLARFWEKVFQQAL
jgi:hypothetical protein